MLVLLASDVIHILTIYMYPQTGCCIRSEVCVYHFSCDVSHRKRNNEMTFQCRISIIPKRKHVMSMVNFGSLFGNGAMQVTLRRKQTKLTQYNTVILSITIRLQICNLTICILENPRGGGGDKLRVILVHLCEPVFLNLPQSYTWSSKKMSHSYNLIEQYVYIFIYCSLTFIYPLCCLLTKFTNKYYNFGF